MGAWNRCAVVSAGAVASLVVRRGLVGGACSVWWVVALFARSAANQPCKPHHKFSAQRPSTFSARLSQASPCFQTLGHHAAGGLRRFRQRRLSRTVVSIAKLVPIAGRCELAHQRCGGRHAAVAYGWVAVSLSSEQRTARKRRPSSAIAKPDLAGLVQPNWRRRAQGFAQCSSG